MNRKVRQPGRLRAGEHTWAMRWAIEVSLSATLALTLLGIVAIPGAAQTFTPTGSMSTPRVHHTATRLNNGKVLIAGGCSVYGPEPVASAELFDPATETFISTGSMNTPRAGACAILLNNGKVLISGGTSATLAIATAELYDPETGAFAPAGEMTVARYKATVTLLNNGNVLIAGGWTGFTEPYTQGAPLDSVEIYDPDTGSFTPAGKMTTPRYLHTAVLLQSGRVLLVGGQLIPNSQHLTSAEVYDPAEGTFTPTAGSMSTGREYYPIVLLNSGKVFIAGGWISIIIASAELYDPATDAFADAGSMNIDRYGHTGTLLNDGKVLIAGGASGTFPGTAAAEIYDPATGTFTLTGNMTVSRGSHTATLLSDGRVLVAGGGNPTDGNLASAELYSPRPELSFEGFFGPVDNPPIINKANAGQTIPVKWRLTDATGEPVSDPTSFVGIAIYPVSCDAYAGGPMSTVDEYAPDSSGLEYMGDGWWQFNWKTSKVLAGQCRLLKLTLADQKEYTAHFSFK